MSVRAGRVVVLLVCLLVPGAAEAQIGRGWLERLSGPGPFRGWPVEVSPVCLARTARDDQRAAGQTEIASHPLRRLIYPRKAHAGSEADSPSAWVTAVGCHFLDSAAPRIGIGFRFSKLHSGANALDYSNLAELGPLPDTGIDLWIYLFTFDIRVTRILDVGAALGWGTFRSQGNIFKTFRRPIGQPMRLTTRPLAVLWKSKRADALLIQFDGTRFDGGFTDKNFGAKDKTYDEPGEMLWSWSIKADLTALLWK